MNSVNDKTSELISQRKS